MLPHLSVVLSCLLPLTDCRTPSRGSDSILDIINTDEVERLIAERKANVDPSNTIDEEPGLWDYYGPSYTEGYLVRRNYSDKLLKSSKDALVVTRRDYLKKDWCKTEPLIQKIKEEGCVSRTIVNSFCYGQCNSFYIPKNPRRRRTYARGELEVSQAFKSCSFCKPKKSTVLIITLKCPALTPPVRRKKILRVKQCKCLTDN